MMQWIEALFGGCCGRRQGDKHVTRRSIAAMALFGVRPVLRRLHLSGERGPQPGHGGPSSYDRKLPGDFVVDVDDSKMAGTYKVAGLVRGASSYVMDARSAFTQSVE